MADNCLESDVPPFRKRRMAMGIEPEQCQPGTRVLYCPSPGRWFTGVVATEPWQLGSGVWVTHLREMEPAYGLFTGKTGDKASRVHAAALTHLKLDPTTNH